MIREYVLTLTFAVSGDDLHSEASKGLFNNQRSEFERQMHERFMNALAEENVRKKELTLKPLGRISGVITHEYGGK